MDEIRGFQKTLVMLSVFYVIAGVVLLFWPRMSLELFCRTLGIAMLVYGIAHVIIYFAREHSMNVMQMDLTIGVISAAFGAYLLLHQDFVQMMLPFAVGILLLTGSIMKLQNAIDMKRMGFQYWKPFLYSSLLFMVLSAILIYDPFDDKSLLVFIGIALILDGAVNIAGMLCLAGLIKKARKKSKGRRETGVY